MMCWHAGLQTVFFPYNLYTIHTQIMGTGLCAEGWCSYCIVELRLSGASSSLHAKEPLGLNCSCELWGHLFNTACGNCPWILNCGCELCVPHKGFMYWCVFSDRAPGLLWGVPAGWGDHPVRHLSTRIPPGLPRARTGGGTWGQMELSSLCECPFMLVWTGP